MCGCCRGRGRPLSWGFPEIAAADDYLPADSVVDGVLVGWSAEGFLNFRRVARADRHRCGRGGVGVLRLGVDQGPVAYRDPWGRARRVLLLVPELLVAELLDSPGVDFVK